MSNGYVLTGFWYVVLVSIVGIFFFGEAPMNEFPESILAPFIFVSHMFVLIMGFLGGRYNYLRYVKPIIDQLEDKLKLNDEGDTLEL